MSFTVSSASRRNIMAVLLALAVLGGVVRWLAPNPSTLRDVGTLLLVLWVPAIGQLIGWVMRKLMGKMPRTAPPSHEFAADSPFIPHLYADMTPVPAPHGMPPLDDADMRCTLVIGRNGFTGRLEQPVARWLAQPGARRAAIELLRPDVAMPHLAAGTAFHLVVGTVALARGEVRAGP